MNGIKDAATLVDLEEAINDSVDLDDAVVCSGNRADVADRFGFDGVNVRVVALLGVPVDLNLDHSCETLFRVEFADYVRLTLVHEYPAFVDSEKCS